MSLTCVCAKSLEHIICKHIIFHFSKNKILKLVQHGCRSKHWMRKQAFVYNKRILHKLHHYGIWGTTLNWIQYFLTNRTQKVVVNGGSSESAWNPVCPRVLFSDPYSFWPMLMTSLRRSSQRFASLHMTTSVSPDKMPSRSGKATGQGRYLRYRTGRWADRLEMCFNPSKWSVLRVSRPKEKSLEFQYTVKGKTLANTINTISWCLP